jgi:small subunit ribosomal protein S20
MANIASVIKRNRQAQKRRVRNSTIRTTVKRVLKDARETVSAKDPAARKEALRKAMHALDKASSQGVYHRRTAARRISRLAKAMAAADAAK